MSRFTRRTCLAAFLLMTGASEAWSQTGVRPGSPRPHQPRIDLEGPTRVSLNAHGVLFVADYKQRKISALGTPHLSLKYTFDVEGRPLSVAAGEERLYVGNGSTQCVQIYSLTGEALCKLGGPDGHFERPTDIAVDDRNRLVFVVDGLGGQVKIFEMKGPPGGVLVGTIPSAGPDSSLLTKPTGIALDRVRGQVLISDHGDDNRFIDPCIRIFDYQGISIDSISGSSGMMGKRFVRPQGLQIRGDRIFLVESFLSRVLIIDRNTGNDLGHLGTYGTGEGELSLPLDLEIDPRTDDLFVTSFMTRRIEIYRDGGAQ